MLQYGNVHGIIVAEKTALSSQYFCELQKFVVLELGLVMLPVSQCSEAAGFLLELVCLLTALDDCIICCHLSNYLIVKWFYGPHTHTSYH